MSAEKGPKHIYAEEHQLYYYYYNFEEHLVQKQEHFATSETRMTRWLRPAGSNMLEPAKMFIRARIIRHNARQSYINNQYSGSRCGAVVRALASHQRGPGLIPGSGVICGLRLLLVLYSAPRGFSPGSPVFPSP